MVIEDFNKKETRKDKKNQVPTSAVVSKKELKEMPKTQNQGNLTAAFAYLVAKLVGNNVLENNSIKEMENILGCEFKSINKDFDKVVKEDQSPYSNDEIEDMLGEEGEGFGGDDGGRDYYESPPRRVKQRIRCDILRCVPCHFGHVQQVRSLAKIHYIIAPTSLDDLLLLASKVCFKLYF